MDFNEMKDKLFSALGKASDGAKDVAEKAADKAKDVSKIAKLTLEISTEKENMKKAYLEIGRLYYDTHKDNPEGFFIQLCDEVALAQENIAKKETEIAAVKSGLNADAGEDITVEFEEVAEEAEEQSCECAEAAETPCECAEAAETPCECAETAEQPCCCEEAKTEE